MTQEQFDQLLQQYKTERIESPAEQFLPPDVWDELVDGGWQWFVSWLATELTKARAFVDKYPKTADGVPVVPGMTMEVSRLRAEAAKETTND